MADYTTEQTAEAWDAEAWDTATQGNFATYNDGGILDVLFTSNEFRLADKPDQFDRIPYEFDVIQNNKSVIFTVGSIRLMAALKELLPLENKRVRIIRTGAGTATQFAAEELSK